MMIDSIDVKDIEDIKQKSIISAPPPPSSSSSSSSAQKLKQALTWEELISLGIGCTIGAGIFVLTGRVAKNITGPALCLSYIFSGLACLFSAFAYAEFASINPSAGSAYGYTRSAFSDFGNNWGEFLGWIIGWDLVLEYAVSAASVAQGWSNYLQKLLSFYSLKIHPSVNQTPFSYDSHTGILSPTGSIFDICSFFITVIVTILLIRGVKESARFNNFMVKLLHNF